MQIFIKQCNLSNIIKQTLKFFHIIFYLFVCLHANIGRGVFSTVLICEDMEKNEQVEIFKTFLWFTFLFFTPFFNSFFTFFYNSFFFFFKVAIKIIRNNETMYRSGIKVFQYFCLFCFFPCFFASFSFLDFNSLGKEK